MRITDYSSNELVSQEIGARVRRARIDYPLTQRELAARAGVSTRTVTNIEHGVDVTFGSLTNILRALGMLSRLEMILPPDEPRPSEIVARKMKRQRVRNAKQSESATTWKWGDEK